MGVLCPEEKNFIEDILSKGFEIENVEGKGNTLEVVIVREVFLSKQHSRIETIVAYFEIQKETFLTNWIHYTKEIYTEEGKVKLIEEKEFNSFKELCEYLEQAELPIPAWFCFANFP